MIFKRNKANHSLLLMPVRLGKEKLPRNKVRILSCDTDGNLFTQLLGRSAYHRIKEEVGRTDMSSVPYATVYWDSGENSFTPLQVEIGEKELWALDRIMEHALRSAVIPDVLKKYPGEIIKLGELKYRELLLEKEGGIGKGVTLTTSKVLQRLPYYRKEDIEVSVPIYKSEYAFPLIILKVLTRKGSTPPDQRPALVLDNDGDIVATNFFSRQITAAKRKLTALEKKGAAGYLVCVQKSDGVSIEVMETTELQKEALENVTRRFEEKGDKKQPVSAPVRKVMDKARERVRVD
jgi:hypothetical protein